MSGELYEEARRKAAAEADEMFAKLIADNGGLEGAIAAVHADALAAEGHARVCLQTILGSLISRRDDLARVARGMP